MGQVTIYGASDDLIEVEGDIREEFSSPDDDEGALLAFSDGTVLRVRYSNTGVWRITPLITGNRTRWHINQAPEDDEATYSDQVTLTSDDDDAFRWVVCGKGFAQR